MVALKRALALACAALLVACAQPAPPRTAEPPPPACPLIANEGHGAFVVHGARVLDGDRVLEPADVLVAHGRIVAVGADICFRAAGGSVSYVEGAGATLLAAVYDDATKQLSRRGRMAAGDPADLVLIAEDGDATVWTRGVRQAPGTARE